MESRWDASPPPDFKTMSLLSLLVLAGMNDIHRDNGIKCLSLEILIAILCILQYVNIGVAQHY